MFALRRARLGGGVESDLPRMHRLDVLCFPEPFRFSVTNLRRYATDAEALPIVAEHDLARISDDLAGFTIVQVYRHTRSAYIVTLDVHPKLRRLGLAGLLVSEGERLAAETGVRAMHLHVYAGNAGAIAFYERSGYVQQTLEKDLYAPGLDAWTYTKHLT